MKIPISVNTIPYGVKSTIPFAGCTNIKNIYFYKGNGVAANYGGTTGSTEGLLKHYEHTPWYYSKDNEIAVTFEDGITSIGNYMFSDCSGLKKIIYNNVEYTSISLFKTAFETDGGTVPTNAFTNSGLSD